MKDTSIFQGWLEWDGYRAENRGATWSIYQQSGNAYIHCAIVHRAKTDTVDDVIQKLEALNAAH